MGEISRLAISSLRKKLADSTSTNSLILDSILTNLHLKYSNSYILVFINIYVFSFFSKSKVEDLEKSSRISGLPGFVMISDLRTVIPGKLVDWRLADSKKK